MEKEHRDSIRKQFSSLVEQTDLDLMVSTLFEKGVFSDAMIEPFKDTSKETRTRKRQLYRDITRRGPYAFGHLLDALMENGYWDLVRDLDPNSYLHNANRPGPSQGGSNFVSISDKKRKNTGKEQQDPNTRPRESGSSSSGGGDRPHESGSNGNGPEDADSSQSGDSGGANSGGANPGSANPGGANPGGAGSGDAGGNQPQFTVIKSTKFFDDNGGDIKLYHTRGANRGVLVLFSYVEFLADIETYRRGALVDIDNLKYVFSEIGFKVLSYTNLSLSDTQKTLASLKNGICGEGPETVFVVFSSHGHARPGTGDTDIRCSDGKLLSFLEVIDYFNNDRFPALLGIPKVFIFQICRGSNRHHPPAPRHLLEPPRRHRRHAAGAGGAGHAAGGGAGPRTQHDGTVFDDSDCDDDRNERIYSDIIIANSTVPGYASNRDAILGSWYIQALCSVFAMRAHDCHVADLFTLVDEELRKRFITQTSSVDRWGFNRHLYLHPGLYDH